MQAEVKQFFAAQAWVAGAWARDVLLSVGPDGTWCDVQVDASLAQRRGATVLDGPVLPGLVNAHSHAFQRAIAGLTECRASTGAGASDDFWSWRDRMYSVALRVTPEQLEHIASLLYAELLGAGYTQVCEFHYLHNAVGGTPYADPVDMSMALVRASQRVGIGLTLLPTLYMRSGFGASGLRDDQRRFSSSPDSVIRLVENVESQTRSFANLNLGVAVHSLRAADEGAIRELAGYAAQSARPVHIHVAEQTQEVQDCLAHTGQRPIEWLLNHVAVNRNWNLVHATHTTPAELKGVCDAGAAIVICPSTEANLGDGVFDYSAYAQLDGQWSIGSDSHVTRSWSEELRLLEYSQRLTQHKRNVAAQASATHVSSAGALFEGALAGGPHATSLPLGSVLSGHRADFVVLDEHAPALLGVPAAHRLDALIFSSPDAAPREVFVAGQQVVSEGLACGPDLQTGLRRALAKDYSRAMQMLWCEA